MFKLPIAPVLGTALMLVACGGDDGEGAATTSGEGGMTLSIVTPEDGGEIEIPFQVELDSSEELGAPESGNHHVHVYFDDDEDTYEIVETESWDVDDIDAPEGEHTLNASLRNADHSPAGVEAEITVNVGSGGAGGSDTSDDSDDAYDY